MYNFLNIVLLHLPQSRVTFSDLEKFIPDPSEARHLYSESSFSQNLKNLVDEQ